MQFFAVVCVHGAAVEVSHVFIFKQFPVLSTYSIPKVLADLPHPKMLQLQEELCTHVAAAHLQYTLNLPLFKSTSGPKTHHVREQDEAAGRYYSIKDVPVVLFVFKSRD